MGNHNGLENHRPETLGVLGKATTKHGPADMTLNEWAKETSFWIVIGIILVAVAIYFFWVVFHYMLKPFAKRIGSEKFFFFSMLTFFVLVVLAIAGYRPPT